MLTYRNYLHVPELLDLQEPVGPDPRSERVFIVVHQVYELWFSVLLETAEAARDALIDARPREARRQLARAHAALRQFVGQFDLLETLSPQEFAAFRIKLGSASGLQSVQYQEVQFLSGAKDPSYLRRARWLTAQERGRLERRLSEPSLWDGYVAALAHHGLPTDSHQQVLESLSRVAADRNGDNDLWSVAEDLRTYETVAAVWRLRHLQIAVRHLGQAGGGTGGTNGVDFLRTRIERRYFPLLWLLEFGECEREAERREMPSAGVAS
jgi:tryptophan 2,3-dioxygenase